MESEKLQLTPFEIGNDIDTFSPMNVSTPELESEMRKITITNDQFKVPIAIFPAPFDDKADKNFIDENHSDKDLNSSAKLIDVSMKSIGKINGDSGIDVSMQSYCDNKPNVNSTQDVTMESIEGYQNQSNDSGYFCDKQIVELSRCMWRGSTKHQRYLKGCLWSPDGTCILTGVNGDGMHIFELPRDIYDIDSLTENRPLDILESVVQIKEAGTIYDFCWYPFMNSSNPASCCWLASRQHEPIQMWDAYHGDLRCSYRGYNAVDEVESALSVLFSPDGQNVLGGYKKNIKIFRTDLPGRDYQSIPIKSPASTIACCVNDSRLAIGSWSSVITLIDQREPCFDDAIQLHGHRGGITYLRFMEERNLLISGARKDNSIFLWDLRNLMVPLATLTRNVNTNQRIYFDVSHEQNWIISGDTNGMIHAWNLSEFPMVDQMFNLHYDCCNGVSFHPTKPIIASSSGQHHFGDDDILTNNNNNNIVDLDNKSGMVVRKQARENSLIFWWCGKMK